MMPCTPHTATASAQMLRPSALQSWPRCTSGQHMLCCRHCRHCIDSRQQAISNAAHRAAGAPHQCHSNAPYDGTHAIHAACHLASSATRLKSRRPHQQASKQHRCLAKPPKQQGASRTNPYRQDVHNKHNKPKTTQAPMLPTNPRIQSTPVCFPLTPTAALTSRPSLRDASIQATRPSLATQAPTQAGTQPRSTHTAESGLVHTTTHTPSCGQPPLSQLSRGVPDQTHSLGRV